MSKKFSIMVAKMVEDDWMVEHLNAETKKRLKTENYVVVSTSYLSNRENTEAKTVA